MCISFAYTRITDQPCELGHLQFERQGVPQMFRERWTSLGPLLLETGFLITDR